MVRGPKIDAAFSALFVLVITLVCNAVVTFIAYTGLVDSIQEEMRTTARTASLLTDGDLHQTLTEPEQKGSPAYLQVQKPYRDLLAANPDLRYIYTAILKDEKIYFIIDTQPAVPGQSANSNERKSTANIMEEYADASPHFRAALHDKQVHVEDEPYSDEWGTFISAYAPIYNSAHEFIGIVGADIDITEFRGKMHSVWMAFGAGLLLSGLLCSIVFLVVYRIRTEQVRKRDQRIAQMALIQGFNYTMQDIASSLSSASSEIQSMTANIAKMTSQSAERTDEAKSTIRGATGRIESIGLVCGQLVSTANNLQTSMYETDQVTQEAVRKIASSDAISADIQKAAGNISGIVGMIDGITERIDLLALNATIEAARAGEAGKGFAVVAYEVKALAQQTADATHQISEYVDQMQKTMQGVVQTFSSIGSIISQISEKSGSTTAAINDQKEFIQLITEDITSVAKSTSTVEASVEAIRSAAHEVQNNTESLFAAIHELAEQNCSLDDQVSEFLKKFERSRKEHK